jgi:hypothetical protein
LLLTEHHCPPSHVKPSIVDKILDGVQFNRERETSSTAICDEDDRTHKDYGQAEKIEPWTSYVLGKLQPGAACHMDFGFIHGPDDLPDMVANGTAKGKHVFEGRHGKNCYLLIIDAATRQL